MTTEQLYTELNNVNHSRKNRLRYANLILAQPELLHTLMDILFCVDDKISCRAAWVLEFMCAEKLDELIPHLNNFTTHMHRVYLDSAVRPVAKICEYLAKAYFSKDHNAIQSVLTDTHKEKMVEVCFDWMINDQKVAVKAYAMVTLYLLGLETDWIHKELTLILERDFQDQSAAYKARARHILKKTKKRA